MYVHPNTNLPNIGYTMHVHPNNNLPNIGYNMYVHPNNNLPNIRYNMHAHPNNNLPNIGYNIHVHPNNNLPNIGRSNKIHRKCIINNCPKYRTGLVWAISVFSLRLHNTKKANISCEEYYNCITLAKAILSICLHYLPCIFKMF